MKMKGFLLALGLLGGVYAVSKFYSPGAGLMVLGLVGVVLSFTYIVQMIGEMDMVAKKAEENERACAAIRMKRKPKAKT